MTETPPKPRRFEPHVYGTVGIPMAAIGLPFAVFMPHYYATELGIGLEVVGLIFMVVRFWDMATDPIMGVLVDKYPSRLGRIRHWLLASVPVLVLAGFALYMPPASIVSPIYLLIWLLVFYAGFTMLQTPHQAWVPALTTDYDERSRFFLWRQIFSTISLLMLLALPTLMSRLFEASRPDQIAAMGWLLIFSLPLTVGLACWWIRDPKLAADRAIAPVKLNLKLLRDLISNRAFVCVLLIEIFVGLAIAATGSTYLFAAEWGFGVGDEASAILLLFFLSGLICMPFWFKLAKRTEKHHTLKIICIYASIAHLSYFPLYLWGSGTSILVLGAILSGVPFGAPLALLRSMMADIVEQDTVQSGEDRSGLTFAFLTSAFKTGQSFAIGIPFVLLGLIAGFDPTGDNSPEAVRNLMIVFSGLPALAYALAAWVAHRYPLTRAVQAAIRSEPSAPTKAQTP